MDYPVDPAASMVGNHLSLICDGPTDLPFTCISGPKTSPGLLPHSLRVTAHGKQAGPFLDNQPDSLFV